MNPYQKRTTTSIASTTAPRVVHATNHHHYCDDDETPSPHRTRPYSLLSNDVNDDDMAINHYDNENDNDDDTTMYFSSSFLQIPRNSNNNNNNTRLPLTVAVTTTTTTAVPPTVETTTTAVPPTVETTTTAPSHSLPNHPIDRSSSSSSPLDDALQQFQMWVQQQQQHLPKKEESPLWQQQLQTHLQQILDLSQNRRHPSSDDINNNYHKWTVAHVQRFVTSILRLLRQQWAPNNNNNNNNEFSVTTESSIITGAILSTLCQLMEDASIWNQSHIYWATTTTTIDHHNAMYEKDPPPYGTTTTTKETSLCTILQKVVRYLIEQHDREKTIACRASYDDATMSLLSGVVFRLSANIFYHQQCIRDHCSLLFHHFHHHHHSIDAVGSGCCDCTTNDHYHFCWVTPDEASTLLQIAVSGSVQSTPTAGHCSPEDPSSQLPIVLSCCSYLLQQMRQPQQSIKTLDDDCIASLLLEKHNGSIVSMIHYVRTHIQNHHLSHPKHATSTAPQTCTDIHISLRYMEVLLTIYAQRYHRNSNRGFTNVRHRNILDDIRQLILVDHVFVQFIIDTMLLQLDTAASFNHIHHQLRPPEMSLSIVKILYDLVPDTIDAILSSQDHPATSWSVSISGTNHHRPTTHQPLLQDRPKSLTQSYVYRAIHTLATVNILIHPNVLNHTMECLRFLHTVQRSIVRQCIISYVTNDENATTPKWVEGTSRAISNLLQQLLYYAEIDQSLPAASFLEQLCTDATDTLRHDELSRRIWDTVVGRGAPLMLSSSPNNPPLTLTFENRLWKALSTILMQHHQCQLYRPAPYPPSLIQLVDLANLVVRNIDHATPPPSSSQRIHGPRAESPIEPALIKCLLHVLAPESRNEGLESKEPLVSKEEDTPTAQNLSRCDITQNHDETNIWNRTETPAFQSKVETQPTTAPTLLPWEPCVQLSVATLLIELTHHSKYWDGGDWTSHDGMVLREQILDTVNAYIVQLNVAATLIPASYEIVASSNVETGPVSPDITRRRLRLLTVLARQTDNEEWLSNVLHISEMRHRDIALETQKRMDHYMLQVKAYQEQEEQLLLENKLLSDQLASLDSKHQFERNEMHRKITQRAKQLVAVHTMDRQQMEQQVRQMSKSVVESQNELEACQLSKQELQSILQEKTLQVTQLRLVEQKHVAQIKDLQTEAQQAFNDLANTKVSLQNACTKNEKLEDELRSHADRVEELKQSEMDVQNCLENLFGDMVKLARAYVAKESEVDSVEEKCNLKLQEVRRCLQAEQERNKQFDKEDRQKQYDYDILQRKYQRLKEKLEQERQDHQRKLEEEKQRSKRNGPISYMNQLHHNASSMNASTATTSSTAHKGPSNSAIDKENLSKNSSWANHRLDRAFR